MPDGDHPRACGENGVHLSGWANGLGSPPRMRGKPCHFAQLDARRGITPAHAGKTLSSLALACRTRDHPRACGENRRTPPYRAAKLGSPPRMRGKLSSWIAVIVITGITPAHAGKTLVCPPLWRPHGDHPRACGENRYGADTCTAEEGSPPRMRGKHEEPQIPQLPNGITPAHAGKTLATVLFRACKRDHPRACGENFRVSAVQR